MKLLDGKKIADERYDLIRAQIIDLERPPSLAVVLVGDDYASHLYVKLKEKAAKKAGIDFHKYFLDKEVPKSEVIETIKFLANDDDIDGILIQLPLPEKFNTEQVINAMGPEKDVDGFHPDNVSAFLQGEDVIYPVFPRALITLAQESEKDLKGLTAVIVGNSDIFTKAMIAACTREGMIIHKVPSDQVQQMKKTVQSAKVVYTACGLPGIISGEYIQKGAIVIDGGVAEVDGKVVGDVEMKSVAKKADFLSPVPGGVGPVTIACLLENVVTLANKKPLGSSASK